MSTNFAKKAIITGITGQDGTYLTKFLLEKNYEIYGILSGEPGKDKFVNFEKIGFDESKIKKIKLEELKEIDLENAEIYNFAGQSSVGASWNEPLITYEVNLIKYLKLLEITKGKNTKMLQASSGEMYGDVPGIINEDTPFNPQNPYAVSKLAAHYHGKLLRESNGEWITNVILFNHESPLRDDRFVLRKIVNGIKDIKEGKADKIELGNIEIERDWGFAEEYVEIMWQLMQKNNPMDVIIATGNTISLKTLISYFFKYFGLQDFESYLEINPDFIRPNDIKSIRVDVTNLKKLGIIPMKIDENNINKLI